MRIPMTKILAGIGLLAGMFSGVGGPVRLAGEGSAPLPIVIAPDAIPAERTAAAILAASLHQVTGRQFAVKTGSAADGPAIFVGRVPGLDAVSGAPDLTNLKPDELVVKTTGDALILTGDRPRGVLYAVYDFLEKDVGVRYWSATETEYPNNPELTVDADRRDAPVFRLRDMDYCTLQSDRAFASRMRINGDMGGWYGVPGEYGGCVSINGWCHTAERLIPADKYFAAHPEWFEMINGGRNNRPNAQLCMTNPELHRELAKNMAAWVRGTPGTEIISLAINDTVTYCSCPDCAAIQTQEGVSGAWFHGVNAVADLLKPEFPDLYIETIAYEAVRNPPEHLVMRDNVLVRVCTMAADQAWPVNSGKNSAVRDAMLKWKKHANNLLVWNYTNNFSAAMMPHPNLCNLAPDLRFFADLGAFGVFEEVDQVWAVGDLQALRTWVLSKLMWNPYQDENKLIDEFLNGYYGDAAGLVRQYIAESRQLVESLGYLSKFNDSSAWIPKATLLKWIARFEAGRATAANEKIAARLDDILVALNFTLVTRPEYNLLSGAKARERRSEIDYDARVAFIQERLTRPGAYNDTIPPLGENAKRMLDALSAPPDSRWVSRVGETPDFCGNQDWLELSAANGNFIQAAPCARVEDPDAAGGVAIEMNRTSIPWTLQIAVPPTDAETVWQIYVSIKPHYGSDAFPPDRVVFEGGYYTPPLESEQRFAGANYKVSELAEGSYQWHKYGQPIDFGRSGYLYMYPVRISDESTFRVDRVILVRQDSK